MIRWGKKLRVVIHPEFNTESNSDESMLQETRPALTIFRMPSAGFHLY